MNEVYLALVGWKFKSWWIAKGINPTEGDMASVGFDWEKVINRSDLIGFYHTHPSFSTAPSHTDITTMNSWTLCLGKPLICCIQSQEKIKGYLFIDDEHRYHKHEVTKFGKWFVGRINKR